MIFVVVIIIIFVYFYEPAGRHAGRIVCFTAIGRRHNDGARTAVFNRPTNCSRDRRIHGDVLQPEYG